MAARAKSNRTERAAADSTVVPALDQKTRDLLEAFRPVVEAHLDDLVADFLEYASAWPEMKPLTQSPEGIACLREAQGRHLLNLFSGSFDEGYFARVSRMGQAHERAGLEPRWYLGAYGHMLKRLVELAIETCGNDSRRLLGIVSAINRVVEIDMACAVATLDETPAPGTATPAPATASDFGVKGMSRAVLGAAPRGKAGSAQSKNDK
jgi:hypothetical protein